MLLSSYFKIILLYSKSSVQSPLGLGFPHLPRRVALAAENPSEASTLSVSMVKVGKFEVAVCVGKKEGRRNSRLVSHLALQTLSSISRGSRQPHALLLSHPDVRTHPPPFHPSGEPVTEYLPSDSSRVLPITALANSYVEVRCK